MKFNSKQEHRNWIIQRNSEYRKGNPTVSDNFYDEVLEDFKTKYPDDELSKKGIIEKEDSDEKEPLPIPMFSLDKLKTIEEIRKWAKNKITPEVTMVATPKLDGISLCSQEFTGKIWTRGDGKMGKNRTSHFPYLKGYQKPYISREYYTFGEAIISHSDWKNYFEGKVDSLSGEPYKYGRNTVSGYIGRKKPLKDILKHIEYIRFGYVDKKNEYNLSKIEQINLLNKLNHYKLPYETFNLHSSDEMLFEVFETLYEKWKKYYDIDGIVIEVNDTRIRKELGRETNNNPAYARAYKNVNWTTTSITKVKSIQRNVSKQGKIKPVINVEPVVVNNVTINKATGYNMKYVFEKNIAPESEIEIVRSGDVIPKHLNTISFNEENVEQVIHDSAVCPSCHEPTKWDDTKTELVCYNENCKDKKLAKIIHFFKMLKIEYFGEKEIENLFNCGYNTIESILNISHDDLSSFEGWGDKSAIKLLSQFEKLYSNGVPLSRLLHALDLFEGKIGEKTCQFILDNYEIMDKDTYSDNVNEHVKNMCEIKGIGEITAEAFVKGIQNYKLKYESSLPISISYISSPKKETESNNLEGLSVCMSGFRDKEIKNLVEKNGGKLASGVSKNTTHLVVKDKSKSSSKITKAEELGIPVLTKEEFLNQVKI